MLARIKSLPRRLIARQIDLYPPSNDVTVKKNVPIPMSDGVILYANRYAPKIEGAFPTVLIRSPWGRGRKHAPFSWLYSYVAQRFAERGYHVILQDIRQANEAPSTQIVPHENEVQDGRDTIRWLSKQAWFNGKLGLWGASYLGYVQWAALVADLPTQIETVAMVPVTTSTRWFSVFHPNGSLALDTLFRLQYTAAITSYSLPKLIRAMLKQEEVLTHALNQLPLTDAIKPLPKVSGFDFEAVMQIPDVNAPLWQKIDLRHTLQNNPANIHLIAGWYDLFLKEQLEDYQALKEAGKKPYLTIGPWHHTSQDLGSASIRTAVKWFDGHLKNKPSSVAPVRLYMLGAERWLELENWPPPVTDNVYFLDHHQRLSSSPPDDDSASVSYQYNPMDPTPSIGGATLHPQAGQQDNQAIEARSDVISYTTDVLQETIEIIGTVVVTLFVSSSLKYTDVVARLCDVDENGRSLNVTDELVRLHLPDAEPNTKQKLEIPLWPTAYRFTKGHRIRLQIASAAHPKWNRNLGTGDAIATGQKANVAEQTIYYGSAYPSQVRLPTFTG